MPRPAGNRDTGAGIRGMAAGCRARRPPSIARLRAGIRAGGLQPLRRAEFSVWSGTWLLTFTDLICLLLTFFVMRFAMLVPEPQHWHDLVSALSTRLNSAGPDSRTTPGAAFNTGALDQRPLMNLDYLAALLKNQLAGHPDLLAAGAAAGLERDDDRLVIVLPVEALFDRAGVEPSERGRRIAFVLAGLLGRLGNQVEVVVHHDPGQPEGAAADGWTLALGRALTLARALSAAGYPHPLAARGAFGVGSARRVAVVVREHGGE